MIFFDKILKYKNNCGIKMQPDFLKIEIQNKNPVELNSLVESMNGLIVLYQNQLEKNGGYKDVPVKLLIDKVEHGSIIITLKDSIETVLPYLAPMTSFAKVLIEILEYYKSKKGNNPNLSKKELEAVKSLVNITGNDIGGNMNFKIDVHNYSIDPTAANAVQNECNKELNKIKEQTSEHYQDVVMRWADTNFLSEKKHGKVIIDEITKTSKNVVFMNDGDREKCTSNRDEYPELEWQKLLYFVDVRVVLINAKIQGYEITKLYDKVLPLEE